MVSAMFAHLAMFLMASLASHAISLIVEDVPCQAMSLVRCAIQASISIILNAKNA
jgi:hypothetical protein